jgi:DNA replication initiation complex subunit (GINS family)
MTIEATLQQIADTLKAIHTVIASGAAVATAAAPAADTPAADKPKAETKTTKATKTETAADKPKADTPPAEKAPDWKADVMPVLLEINKSTKPEHGRAGLLKVMGHFGLPDGSKVPDLEKLGKHAEVLAFAKGVLNGEPAAGDDDLGI